MLFCRALIARRGCNRSFGAKCALWGDGMVRYRLLLYRFSCLQKVASNRFKI